MFFWRAHRMHKKQMKWVDGLLSAFFLLILFPSFTILGTIGSIYDIVDALQDSSAPFTCAMPDHRIVY